MATMSSDFEGDLFDTYAHKLTHPDEVEWRDDVERDLAKKSTFIRGLDRLIEEDLVIFEEVSESHPEKLEQEFLRSLRDWILVKGLVWEASIAIVDDLFDDIVLVRRGEEDGNPHAWLETRCLKQLPRRYGLLYTTMFTKMFLVAMVDVTCNLANEWVTQPTVAHEIATDLLLTKARSLQVGLGIQLEFDHLSDLATDLFADRDFEMLYSETDEEQKFAETLMGAINLDIGSWFGSFGGVRAPSPYAMRELHEELP